MSEKPLVEVDFTGDREFAHSRLIDARWRQLFDTAAERQRIAEFVIPANEQNLDRLAAEVLKVL